MPERRRALPRLNPSRPACGAGVIGEPEPSPFPNRSITIPNC